jgi:hypothetical protein
MQLGFRLLHPLRLGLVSVLFVAAHAQAQDPAPPAAEPVVNPPPAQDMNAPPAPPPPTVAPPVAPAPPVEAPPPAPEAPPPPPPPLPAPPVEEPPADDLGPLKLGVWVRADLALSNASSSAPGNFPSGDKLDDIYSTGEAWVLTSGKVHEYVKLTGNFASSYNNGGPGGITSSLTLLDGIVQLEPSEYFNVWIGRHLVPVDRSNFSGPFFMAPWFYPGFGFADGQVAAPREGPYGRNDGATVWGQFGGGVFKYYAGMFDLHNPAQSPLFSGRLSLHLLSPEPGFYGSSTFFGKDLLGIGVGVQSKKDGSTQTDADGVVIAADDYTGFNADVLFEKDLGASGVLDLEGAFYIFDGEYERTESAWFALASYLLPMDVAGGKLQPTFRVQQAMPKADGAETSTLIDAQVSYIVNSYATRFTAGYRTGFAGDLDVQALFFGAQVQK